MTKIVYTNSLDGSGNLYILNPMALAILLHDHFDEKHLEAVKSEMKDLGSPRLRGIYTGEVWYLLEGCHRARAAVELGVPVDLVEVPYPEDDSISIGELLGDGECDAPVADVTGRPSSTVLTVEQV